MSCPEYQSLLTLESPVCLIHIKIVLLTASGFLCQCLVLLMPERTDADAILTHFGFLFLGGMDSGEVPGVVSHIPVCI